MAVPAHHRGRNAYHFTSIQNLESIIDHCIFSTNQNPDNTERIKNGETAPKGKKGENHKPKRKNIDDIAKFF